MILLDTNVLSEPLRHAPEPRVIESIDAQAMETLFLSAIMVAELRAVLSSSSSPSFFCIKEAITSLTRGGVQHAPVECRADDGLG